ncbi:hypothetical protein HZH66_002070 [Vespula vulgaris]|uniref:Gustatory receptor n=1 Tax=Vespula vulgaris TaxID=7454 RepID=A0A834KIV8_VESVU|nr:hypothetical protein HZH66_002070 [Vespula vulgaris]
MGLYRSEESKLCAKKINEIDKTLQALGSPTSFSKQILTNQPLYKSSIVYFSIFLHMYGFMIEFLLVIEFYTIIRCIKLEFQQANKLLEDNNVQSSVTKELIEQRKLHGSLSTESLFVCSKQLLNPSTNTLLRTIRQVHLELYRDVLDIFKGVYGTDVVGKMSTISFVSNAFFYIITVFDCLKRRKRLKLFIEQLEICIRKIDELNISRTYSSSFRYQCFAGVFLICLIFNLIACDIYWFSHIRLSIDYSLMFQFCYFDSYPLIVTLVIDFTFVFWIRQIKFAQLNAILQSMLTTTIDSPQHKRVLRMKDNWENDSSLSTIYRMYKANENLVKLKRIKQIHLELMKCARIIMEAYGIPIIMSMTISIIFTIMLLYYILYELYEPSTSKEFRDEIRNFIFQLTQNRLTFTACGFYDLNHTFIYSAIGWITTYLVILIQVGDKPKLFKNVNNNSTL